MPARSRPGFTLIELLVVVTIIVVLLSLLAPAMDSAIYQAELAVCAAQKKAVANGSIAYAFEYKRRYPNRQHVIETGSNASIIRISMAHVNAAREGRDYDDRPMIEPYFDLNGNLNDPLATPVDFEHKDPETTMWTGSMLWFGWSFQFGFAGESGMFKVGDRWTFRNNQMFYQGKSRLYRFRTLVSDRESFIPGLNASGSHPDKDGVLKENVFDNEFIDRGHPSPQVQALEKANNKTTLQEWTTDPNAPTSDRGLVDTNHAYDDGSVRRIDNLGNGRQVFSDDRVTFVPNGNSKFLWAGLRARVPRN